MVPHSDQLSNSNTCKGFLSLQLVGVSWTLGLSAVHLSQCEWNSRACMCNKVASLRLWWKSGLGAASVKLSICYLNTNRTRSTSGCMPQIWAKKSSIVKYGSHLSLLRVVPCVFFQSVVMKTWRSVSGSVFGPEWKQTRVTMNCLTLCLCTVFRQKHFWPETLTVLDLILNRFFFTKREREDRLWVKSCKQCHGCDSDLSHYLPTLAQ